MQVEDISLFSMCLILNWLPACQQERNVLSLFKCIRGSRHNFPINGYFSQSSGSLLLSQLTGKEIFCSYCGNYSPKIEQPKENFHTPDSTSVQEYLLLLFHESNYLNCQVLFSPPFSLNSTASPSTALVTFPKILKQYLSILHQKLMHHFIRFLS